MTFIQVPEKTNYYTVVDTYVTIYIRIYYDSNSVYVDIEEMCK